MFAAILIPEFSLQAALRLEPDLRSKAVALIDPALPRPNIVQLTAAARARGVVEGLTPSQATARCAELRIKTRSAALDQSATDILLQTAYSFSPNIEDTAPGVCTMELKGLGLEAEAAIGIWAGRILETLEALNLEGQIGVAITPALALLAARAASEGPVARIPERESPAGANGGADVGDSRNSSHRGHDFIRLIRDSRAFLSTLPVTALEPAPEISAVLERWGIRTVGALLALDKAELTDRLGPEILPLLQRVSPHSIRPLKLVLPRQTFEEEVEFETEIETAEPLLFMLNRFVEQLAKRLDVLHLVVAQLNLNLKLSSGATYERQFRIPSPTGEVKTLFRTLQTHLETVRTDAPIVSLRLEARPSLPQTHQFGLFEATLKDPNQFAETLARLTALCGSDRVGTPAPVSTHRPDVFDMREPQFDGEREDHRSALTPALPHRMGEGDADPAIDLKRAPNSVGHVASRAPLPLLGDAASARSERPALPAMARAKHVSDMLPAPIATTLPLRRFRPPLPAFVELREERPALIRSEVFNGAILDTRGPFHTSGDWWDRHAWAREEWDVQAADGTLFRIFRADGEFFVEGIYD